MLKLQGRAPFRWQANGRPLVGIDRRRIVTWQPDGAGYCARMVALHAENEPFSKQRFDFSVTAE